MRIQHNIAALNAYRNYNNNTSALSKNLEKLSSGYKINRAGDDAAGLAISEKMRAQITGLNTASKNVKDGISLVKTAEGAMQEVQDMLNRMVDLATQSANGTYQDEVDREALQAEIDQLNSEIDRIADSANFNGIKLLDGSLDSTTVAGVKYTDKTSTELEDIFVNGFEDKNWEGVTEKDVIAGDNVLETEGGAKSTAGFQISLDGTTAVLKNGESFQLTIGDLTIETKAADSETTLTSSQLASKLAENNSTIKIKDADGTEREFTVKNDGNMLTFTTTDSQDFKLNTSAPVSWTVGDAEEPEEDPMEVTDPDSTVVTVNDGSSTAPAANATLKFDLEGFAVDKAGTVTFTIGGQDYDVEITEAEVAAKDTTSLDVVAAAKLVDALNANKLDDNGGAGAFTASLDSTGGTAITLTSADQDAIANSDIKGTSFSVAAKAAPADESLIAPQLDGAVGLADEGSVSNDDAKEITLREADSDSGAEAVTTTATATAQLAAKLDGNGAKSGEVSVLYDQGEDTWSITAGGKTLAATATFDTDTGALTLSVEDGDDTVDVLSFAVTGAGDDDDADAIEALFKDIFTTTQATGIQYTAPAEGGGGKEPTPVETEVVGSDIGINWATDSDIGANADAIKALKFTITDSTSDLVVDLKDLDISDNDTVEVVAGKILDAAKTAIEAWNTANSATAGYKYVNPKIVDGTTGDIMAQATGSGLKLQAEKEELANEKDSGATSSGTINSGLQNVTDNNSGASAQLANTVVDFSKASAWQDGAKITIGDTTYTVAIGKDSKFAGAKNVIDMTDLTGKETDLAQTAAQRLTVAAKDNSIFTVGHDGKGNTTLQQKSEVKETTDMTTKEKVAGYLGVSTANPDSLENAKAGKGLTLQIGDTSDSYNQLTVEIGDIHADALGVGSLNVGTQEGAQKAIDTIKAAINQVSSIRGTLGATQNRLEHTSNNLSVMAENIQDAESTIRDTDVAEEMMSYVKNNILVQSAQAMLAQANQLPQGVLQLLG